MDTEELQSWAHKTCFEISAATDLKEICKARGFNNLPGNAGKSALAEFVEMRITGPQGVRGALTTLDVQSLWVLHALKCAARPVEIGEIYFFYWGALHVWDAAAFKKRYEHIRDRLVNKGVVLVREIRDLWGKRSHYERIEFLIPDVVAESLPALPLESEPVVGEPVFADWAESMMEEIRRDLLPLYNTTTSRCELAPAAVLNKGAFRLGKREHPSAELLYEMLTRNWLALGNTKRSGAYSKAESDIIDPNEEKDLGAIRLNRDFIIPRKYILNSIPFGHAVRLPRIFEAFNNFKCPMTEETRRVFVAAGVRFGFLSRVGETYAVNLKRFDSIGSASFEFSRDVDGSLSMPLGQVRLSELLFLGQISCLEIRGHSLYAKPSVIQLGRKRTELDESQDARVLWARSAVFHEAFDTVKKRDKKLIVHSNLTLLKLGGSDIKALFKAAYSDCLAPLGNDYYAISREDLNNMLSYAKKKGFKPKILTSVKGERE
jgi:hypothetical protein